MQMDGISLDFPAKQCRVHTLVGALPSFDGRIQTQEQLNQFSQTIDHGRGRVDVVLPLLLELNRGICFVSRTLLSVSFCH